VLACCWCQWQLVVSIIFVSIIVVIVGGIGSLLLDILLSACYCRAWLNVVGFGGSLLASVAHHWHHYFWHGLVVVVLGLIVVILLSAFWNWLWLVEAVGHGMLVALFVVGIIVVIVVSIEFM